MDGAVSLIEPDLEGARRDWGPIHGRSPTLIELRQKEPDAIGAPTRKEIDTDRATTRTETQQGRNPDTHGALARTDLLYGVNPTRLEPDANQARHKRNPDTDRARRDVS